jgi:hypothetical protein
LARKTHLPPRIAFGDNLISRIAFAVWEWHVEKRGRRLFRRFLAEPAERAKIRERVQPEMVLLMRLLEEFVESNLDRIQLNSVLFAFTCEAPFKCTVPPEAGMRWWQCLVAAAEDVDCATMTRQCRVVFVTQESRVAISCELAKMTADPKSPPDVFVEQMREDARKPFMVLTKSTLPG